MSIYLFKPHQKGSRATYLQYLQYLQILQDSQSTLITEAKSKQFLGMETKVNKLNLNIKMNRSKHAPFQVIGRHRPRLLGNACL